MYYEFDIKRSVNNILNILLYSFLRKQKGEIKMKKFYMGGALLALLTVIHSDPSMAVEIPVSGSKTFHYSFVIKPVILTKENIKKLVSKETGLKINQFTLLLNAEKIDELSNETIANTINGPGGNNLEIQ